ncbi:MAG TPA: PadR family transcriptional regulator [Candidatus Nanoarchaeia archaeon]|nr:PadR family transcriptional regulator [Candidatus Nanoarchaeia archaeon]
MMHLKYIVIQLLQEKPHSGYDLMKAIYESCGWKPSPGSMYPVLEGLAKSKKVVIRIDGKKKVYSLTPEGSREAKKALDETGKVVDKLMQNLKLFSRIYMHEDKWFESGVMNAFEELRRGKLPLGMLTKDMIELKKEVLRLYIGKKCIKEGKRIKKILQRATKELKKIN